jgi:uncharacterized Zn-binding protein involved in type VI secretion
MAGIARIGIDTAGGIIVSNVASCNVYINGAQAVLAGATIAPHGDSPHSNAKMTGSSGSVFVNGLGVVRRGDVASCGHVATGSGTISAA